VTWEIIYFKLAPGFIEKYTNYVIERLRTSSASPQVIEAKLQEMKSFKELYDKPLINAAISFIEPLPVGLLMTLISAAILRKKRQRRHGEEGVREPALSS
jgi:hypothetical protein